MVRRGLLDFFSTAPPFASTPRARRVDRTDGRRGIDFILTLFRASQETLRIARKIVVTRARAKWVFRVNDEQANSRKNSSLIPSNRERVNEMEDFSNRRFG